MKKNKQRCINEGCLYWRVEDSAYCGRHRFLRKTEREKAFIKWNEENDTEIGSFSKIIANLGQQIEIIDYKIEELKEKREELNRASRYFEDLEKDAEN